MLTLTRQLYKWLIANGVVQLNPADGIPSTGKPADEATAFTAETLSTIRTHICGDGYEVGFPLTLCGLRRSELMGLTWEDIDSEAGTLAIRRSRTDVGGGASAVGPPKTIQGRRTLPLDDELLGLLADLKR